MLLPDRYDFGDLFKDLSFDENKTMKCDIYEKNNSIYIDVDLPAGYQKENVKLDYTKGYLTITAEKETENNEEDKDKKFIRRERQYGKYERQFYLGNVKENEITASYKDGTLEVIAPKSEAELPKQIEIK